MKKKLIQEVCQSVIALDETIRFAGIADEDGNILGIAEREGLKPIFTPEQRDLYAITAATRQYTRLRWEYVLGKIHYASSRYAELIRATIPISDSNGKLIYVLLLSFDPGISNLHKIIMKKIIPLIEENTVKLIG